MVSVKYKRPKDAVYPTSDGKLSIHFESALDSSGAVFGTAVTLKEMASVSLRFSKALVLEDLIAQYQLLEDLLLILTGSDSRLRMAVDCGAQVRTIPALFPEAREHRGGIAA